VVSLLVLALWATCTLRCEIELLAPSAAMSCCGETGEQSNPTPTQPEHCICSFIQSRGFISEKRGVPLPLPKPALFVATALRPPHERPPKPAPAELISPSPELIKGWQFSHRAAAPPRAPSFVS